MNNLKKFCLFPAALMLAACGTAQKPLPVVDYVDIDRFMGDWYVIANIPTFIERDACNAVESYALQENGSIATTFTFNKGGCDGPLKSYHPTGFVREGTGNAIWGMQFIWPVKADYRIFYLAEDYSQTVIGRNKRDYLWIMARTPAIPGSEYRSLLRLLDENGYDTTRIQRVPHGTGSSTP